MSIAYSPVFEDWMRQALAQAEHAGHAGDVPVGALVVASDGEVISLAHNRKEVATDPTAHAEVLAIRAACLEWESWQLPNTTLVTTLEPCVLCAGAILAARIPRVIFGAWDDKAGAAGSMYDLLRDRRLNHQVEVIGGVLEDDCGDLLRTFFVNRRHA